MVKPTRHIVRRAVPLRISTHRAYYGKPACLFKDSDKDGVPNVFDCQPFNRKRQDKVIRETPSGRRDEWRNLDKKTAKKIYKMALDSSENWPGHRDVWIEEGDD